MPDANAAHRNIVHTPLDAAFQDPLGTLSREARNRLLLVSVISILVATIGLVPTKIEALGVEFSAKEQAGLLYALSLFTVYFGIEFAVYGLSDIYRWRTGVNTAVLAYRRQQGNTDESEVSLRDMPIDVRVRYFFDTLFPMCLGVIAASLPALRHIGWLD